MKKLKLTRERQERFVKALGETGTVSAAVEIAGTSRTRPGCRNGRLEVGLNIPETPFSLLAAGSLLGGAWTYARVRVPRVPLGLVKARSGSAETEAQIGDKVEPFRLAG
jgi:hypothetical protein